MGPLKKRAPMKTRIFAVATFVCALIGSNCNGQARREIRIKTQYMSYACGECYPQYHILKILSTKQDKRDFKYLIGKDIHIEFNGKAKTEIEQQMEECPICFFYEVSGVITKKDTTIALIASDYRMYDRFKNCCNDFRKRISDGRANQSP